MSSGEIIKLLHSMYEIVPDESALHRSRINGGTHPLVCKNMTRWNLAEFFNKIGYTLGAEVGVLRGAYSQALCNHIPNLKLKCIDPWLPFRLGRDPIKMEGYFHRAKHRLSGHHVEFIRKTSMEAVKDIPDRSLDFVYIDAMHEFDFVMMDIIAWADKVRRGGIVSGHDYGLITWCNGVLPAVQAYTFVHRISPWFITNDTIMFDPPSWFWVVPE